MFHVEHCPSAIVQNAVNLVRSALLRFTALFHVEQIILPKAEVGHRLISRLDFGLRKVYGPLEEARGVPVLSRPNSNPTSINDADNPVAAASPARPPAC